MHRQDSGGGGVANPNAAPLPPLLPSAVHSTPATEKGWTGGLFDWARRIVEPNWIPFSQRRDPLQGGVNAAFLGLRVTSWLQRGK